MGQDSLGGLLRRKLLHRSLDTYSRTHAMPIDNCQHDFQALTSVVLPEYLRQLREAMRAPHQACVFSRPGVGPISIARTLGLQSDFSGCYVLLERQNPIYVGISRRVLNRLRQHVTGKDHFDASLAYRIAQQRRPTPGQRREAMQNALFREEFNRVQSYLRGLDAAFVPIANPLELYVFEAYAAMALDTSIWNTFRTH